MKIKIKRMAMTTPLGEILISGDKEDRFVSSEDFNEMMREWRQVLQDTSSFHFPTEYGMVYALPRNVLQNSFIKVEIEEVDEG